MLNSLCILFVNTSLALSYAALFVLDLKLSGMFVLFTCVCTLSILFHGFLLVLQLGLLDASIVCKSNFQLLCGSLITLYFILSMFSCKVCGIPSSAGPSSGVTKNLCLHFYLCVLILLYTCLIVQYLCDCMFLIWFNYFYGMHCSYCWVWEWNFEILSVALNYHHFWCLFYMLFVTCFDWCLTLIWWILLILHYQKLGVWYLLSWSSCHCSLILMCRTPHLGRTGALPCFLRVISGPVSAFAYSCTLP